MTCACPTCGKPLDLEGFRFEAEAGIVIGGGKFAALTVREAAVFEIFWSNPGRVLSKAALTDQVYSLFADDAPAETIIDVFVCRMRRKLASLGLSIETVWGQGYRLRKKRGQA